MNVHNGVLQLLVVFQSLDDDPKVVGTFTRNMPGVCFGHIKVG